MSASVEIWACPECGAELDISELGFYKEVTCPNCAYKETVHTQLANFRLTGVLGIGGMSVVFKANDMILNRPLAIKVLNDTYKDQPERIARFENECAMMARVRHDNVVSVYSAGWARGQFYIAMELVRGHDMEHVVIHGKPLAPAAALDVAREVTLGLQAAAQAGLLHRDMKPGNILISQMNGRAKVLDFGLSLGAQSADTEEVIWATPFYVAPETLKRGQEDVRTDIYALGMTLRFLLTGVDKLPLEFSSITDLLAAKKKLPSFAGTLPAAVSEVVDLVDHMTAFNPDERPPSYQELLQELDEARAAQRREDDTKAPERSARRLRAYALAVAGTLLTGLVGTALVTCLHTPEPKQELIDLVEYSEWGDIDTFGQGLQALGKSNWAAAKSAFKDVCNRATEPTIAATSAAILYYFAITENDPKGKIIYLNRLHDIIAESRPCFPAAANAYSDLQKMEVSLMSWQLDESIRQPLLKAISAAALADRVAGRKPNEATAFVQRTRAFFSDSPALVKPLASRLDNLQERAEKVTVHGRFAKVHETLAEHDFKLCDDCLANLGRQPYLTAAERKQLIALREIRSVAEAVVNLLKKRVASIYCQGKSPDVMRYAASRLSVKDLDKEVYCLSLLMQGDYSKAFNANPYKSDPKSSLSFAILMRRWESLLPADANLEPDPREIPLHFRKVTVKETTDAMLAAMSRGASVATIDGEGNSPLHWAVGAWRHEEDAKNVIAFLFERAHADLNLRNKSGKTVLDLAAQRFGEKSDIVLYLVGNGATGTTDPAESKHPVVRQRRLLGGIKCKDIDICRKALKNGADARSAEVYDSEEKVRRLGSPGWTEIVALLLEKGMDPNCHKWYSIMHLATEPKTVELLLKKGADPDLPAGDGFSPLFCVNDIAVAEVLLKRGADVNFKSSNGRTPLMVSWSARMIDFFLANGADTKAKSNNGTTAMHMWRGGAEHTRNILSKIISKGGDVNACDNGGNTPAHVFALTLTYPDEVDAMMEFLKQNGADLNIKNKAGETVLDICTKRFGAGNDCVKHLLKNGAKSGK